MGRLPPKLLERVEAFGDRVLDVVDVLERQKRSRRILDQMTGAGTSVGANAFEADESVTRPMVTRSLAVSLGEASETRYWIRLVARRGWIKPARLGDLEQECMELQKIFGAMIVRTARTGRDSKRPKQG